MKYKYIAGCLIVISVLFAFKAFNNRKINLIFIGDSITYGAGLIERNEPPPPFYAAAYLKHHHSGTSIKYLDLGVSGYTTLDFLPVAGTNFSKVKATADTLYSDTTADLIFSIMLGTNDSAIQGPHGAPVSATNYRLNLKRIVDSLLLNYPRSKIIINYPLWYSPNTHNHSSYLQAGLSRLQTYFPEIDTLVNTYGATQSGHVFIGNKAVFNYFKKHYLSNLTPETGQDGIFYLHPNAKGAAVLGEFWGKSINKVLNK